MSIGHKIGDYVNSSFGHLKGWWFSAIIEPKYTEYINNMAYRWRGADHLESKSYTCGHCDNPLASNIGYFKGSEENGSGHNRGNIYICHHCFQPTYFNNEGIQFPGIRIGKDVSGIDDEKIISLYNEARDAFSVSAFTAVVLSCRKILMHVAVAKGAEENLKFVQYVEYLSSKNYIPEGSKGWVEHIKDKGNEANHEIKVMSEKEADVLLSLTETLLYIIYELPSRIPTSPSKES